MRLVAFAFAVLVAANAYLDRRAEWWIAWPGASRDGGTVCVSCHTTLPYALVRGALGGPPTPPERRIVDSVVMRVRHWSDVKPYYADRPGDPRKAVESLATESVLNALVLASTSRTSSTDLRLAFEHMWAEQDPDGGWPWLRFDLEPWEGRHSAYFGAVLAAQAVATAPAEYRVAPAAQKHLQQLRVFLASEYDKQPLVNRTALLWTSAKMPELLDASRRSALVDALVKSQRRDGGWSLEAMIAPSFRAWLSPSDGYATGLATLALLPTPARETARRGVAWLKAHQNPADGSWPAASLNARRDPRSDAALFMTDAATAFAVLAIDAADHVR